MIPEDWVVARIDEYYDVISSKRVLQRDWKSRGVPFYRAREVAVLAEKGVVDNELFITEDLYLTLKSKYGVPKVGDALVTGIGTIGKVYTVSPDNMFYFKDASVLWLKSRGGYSSEFLKQVFLTDIIVKQIKNSSMGTTVETYTIQSAKKTLVPTPSLEEQRAIATALSDVDALITALDKLIAKKRAIKTAAMQQLLTGKTRLPGFSGEWKTKRLGDYVKFFRNGTNSRSELISEGKVKYLHYGDIHVNPNVYLDIGDTEIPCLPITKAKNLDRLRDGDLVFVDASEDQDGIGKSVEIVNVRDVEAVAGLHTIAARFDKSVLADGFKAFLQYIPEFRRRLQRLGAGTKVFATNRAHIASAEIRLPPVEEQTAIAQVLSDMDAEIAALEARRDKTRAIKQGMMQQVLTGRVRLVKPEMEAC